MIIIHAIADTFTGATAEELEKYKLDALRQAEVVSIRRFVEDSACYLRGCVLDFGAGKPGTCREPQPYRDLVQGEYVPVDIGDEIPPVRFSAILCTQVLQYLADPIEQLEWFHNQLFHGGYLVLSYTTNWPEVEPGDFHRFTKSGMERMLHAAGFKIVSHEPRAALQCVPNIFVTGYGVVARKK